MEAVFSFDSLLLNNVLGEKLQKPKESEKNGSNEHFWLWLYLAES